jgi:hypothetical protein
MKESYYFSHDANAHNDPKIMKMMLDLKSEGYGIYWIIIEMLRNERAHKLRICDCNAIAYQAHCECNTAIKVIKGYGLFEISEDGEYFWSDSLIRRMEEFRKRSETARNSAQKRWNKCDGNANAMPMQCDGNAVKESKVKESKVNKALESQDFLSSLKTNLAYKHINIETELGRMDAWLAAHPGRIKTRKFVVNWLNKIDPPLPTDKPKTRIIA